MMAKLKHLKPELLSDYALGRLGADEYCDVAEHLEQCEQCQDTMSRLELPTDTFIRNLAGPVAPAPFVEEPECAAALQAIREIGCAQAASASHVDSASQSAGHPPYGLVRDYELLEPLGHGGMGMVYRARHTRLDRLVAIKLLPMERTLQPQAVARFHREMKAIGNLDHPNIVRASDAGEVEGKHFLVMELIDGVDLATLAEREGQMSVSDACELIRQAALGLDYAHGHGLVHRDVKPSNLMLDRRGVVRVLDLGLARLLEAGERDDEYVESSSSVAVSVELTGDSQALGTPDYMAPEQCRDSRAVDARTDVYGLAATLYRLLAGRTPYSGQRYNTVGKKIAGLLNDPPPPLDAVRDNLPAGLLTLVHRSLARQPQERPATCAEFAELLAPYCRGHEVGRLASGEVAAPAAGAVRDRIRRLVVALGAAGALAALGLLIARINTSHGELTVEVADAQARDAVKVEVRRGDVIHVLSSDPQEGWSITLDEGAWNVELKDPRQEFQLDAKTVTITRDGEKVVRVTRRPKSPTASTLPASASQAKPALSPPQPGNWTLTMPDGFTRTVSLTPLGGNRFRLQTGGVLGGMYFWNGRFFLVIDPDDDRFTGLKWQWEGDGLSLVAEPTSLPTGQSYRGSRLQLQDAKPSLPEGVRLIKEFAPPQPNDGGTTMRADAAVWRYAATETRTFQLSEIANPEVESCILAFQAELKAEKVSGRAYLELVCVWPEGDPTSSQGVHAAIRGDDDWTTCDAVLLLPAGKRTEAIRLNLVIEGGGTVLMRDVVLLAKSLPLSAKATRVADDESPPPASRVNK